jgi:hypothetical protein
MAKRKKTTKRRTTKRRTTAKAPRRRSSRKSGMNMTGMQGALMEIGKGVLGYVLVAKAVPLVLKQFPTADKRMVYGGLTLASAALAIKGGRSMAAVGIGAGITSGAMLLQQVAPNLLGTGAQGAIGRASYAGQQRMQRAAEAIRSNSLGGPRSSVITGSRSSVITGDRSSVITGDGYIDPRDY